jgi:hypothetical protein
MDLIGRHARAKVNFRNSGELVGVKLTLR